jgi:nucleotide-binding universal stress UspA family protein
LIEHVDEFRSQPTIELVTVHRPVPKVRGMGAAVGKSQIERYYQEEGEQALADAKKLLERTGMPYQAQVLVGEPAEKIVEHCDKAKCDLIAVGAKGRSTIGKMLLGSTATKVLQLSETPVLLLK